MDVEEESIEIARLCYTNFHVWESRIQLVLSLRELDDCIEDDPPAMDSNDSRK